MRPKIASQKQVDVLEALRRPLPVNAALRPPRASKQSHVTTSCHVNLCVVKERSESCLVLLSHAHLLDFTLPNVQKPPKDAKGRRLPYLAAAYPSACPTIDMDGIREQIKGKSTLSGS